jgi:hypothetical protein
MTCTTECARDVLRRLSDACFVWCRHFIVACPVPYSAALKVAHAVAEDSHDGAIV